ncbi:MAG: DUF1501 domain-containing protein [Planctomycetaceae bacterium]|nr:DUF1501 domain-containing protein [Planctomycetaceae bacterium]MBT6154240.1 DUF1501 domain-containing protein [Planctomycetaceae bacterium]MBT6485662.1 DUF1501 domain-containing protein [Planctomycetaceae bacterium]MBT6497436.1 DUF1501 domain-containing protein [Planctomycetaceae bacterium]
MSKLNTACCSRRHFVAANALGIGSVALNWLLNQDEAQCAVERPELAPKIFDLKPKPPQEEPQARAMISLWMQGGPSHIDLFDPKPEMAKYDGKTFPGKIKYDNAAQASSTVLASPWRFHKRGECGMELSELLPALGGVADDITLIRSMRTGVNNHGQSIRALNTGRILGGRPSLGSWMTYGLGAETENLPAYVALIDPGQLPVLGVENWSNGWLPSIYQGTVVRPQEPRILNLDAPPQLAGAPQRKSLDYLRRLNQRHLEKHPAQLDLQARIASYELAARMQLNAKEALDLSKESKATQALYGMDEPVTREYGSRCLIARRLVERGVRFVQVFTQNQFWDHHGRIRKSLPTACKKIDKPGAALVADLKARGLLDSTVVHWGGEMGRLPVIQNNAGRDKVGRDHNTHGFSMWLAGGGFKRGCVYGATDDFGHQATENVVNHYDYHATLLHQFGINHSQLLYKRNARDQTLTDGQDGRIVGGILA